MDNYRSIICYAMHLMVRSFPMPERVREADGAFKIGYCGTIAQWCDWELLTKLVEARPGVEVHLVGPLDAGASLQVHSQIVWHGPVEHGDLPEIMGAFDCLIMPFKVTPLIESVDPVKLYEYVNFGSRS